MLVIPDSISQLKISKPFFKIDLNNCVAVVVVVVLHRCCCCCFLQLSNLLLFIIFILRFHVCLMLELSESCALYCKSFSMYTYVRVYVEYTVCLSVIQLKPKSCPSFFRIRVNSGKS